MKDSGYDPKVGMVFDGFLWGFTMLAWGVARGLPVRWAVIWGVVMGASGHWVFRAQGHNPLARVFGWATLLAATSGVFALSWWGVPGIIRLIF